MWSERYRGDGEEVNGDGASSGTGEAGGVTKISSPP